MMTRGRVLFLFASLITVFFVAGTSMLAQSNREKDDGTDSLYKYVAVFTEVFSLVNKAYVDEREIEPLMAGAFEGAVDALDPFSLYVPAAAVEGFEQTRQVGARRSGMLVLKERGVAYVVAVEEGSPAADAGIEAGHLLMEIGGRPTREMPLFEIQAILAGPAGTEIELERIHQGQKKQIQLTLGEYTPPGVALEAQRGVAVLRLAGFHQDTLTHVETSLETIAAGTAALPDLGETDKLLIDLRGVAGGDEDVAYRVAGLFAGGELGALKARDEEIEVFRGGESPRWQGRVVVLIDRATQGPAEVLASVLQQTVEATLVGEGSFGHSGRQSLMELTNGGRLQLTSAFFTGPDREPINRSLDPDLAVRPNPFASEEELSEDTDEVLDRGLAVLLGEEEIEERQAA